MLPCLLALALAAQPAPGRSADEQIALDAIASAIRMGAMRFEDPSGAVEAVEKAEAWLKDHPESSEGHLLLGQALTVRRQMGRGGSSPLAASPAAAFARAASLDPGSRDAAVLWALADPGSAEALAAAEAHRSRDPADPGPAFAVARAEATPRDRAVELLRGVRGCVEGQGLFLGGLLEERKDLGGAAEAYLLELTGCPPAGYQWNGVGLSKLGEARQALARVSLSRGDLAEAWRQLAWLRLDSVEAALELGDLEVRHRLEVQVLSAARKKPLRDPSPATPRGAIERFERAGFRSDSPGARALLVPRSPAHALFIRPSEACESYLHETVGSWSLLILCSARQLVPEAPTTFDCEEQKDRATCTVTGRQPSDVRVVTLRRAKGGWKIERSERRE